MSELHDACRSGDLENIKRIIAEDASLLNRGDDKGFSPLTLAVYNDQQEVTKYLLSQRKGYFRCIRIQSL